MFLEDKYNYVVAPPAFQPLLDAAAYMRKHGWIQRDISRKNGVCVVGAIMYAVEDRSVRHTCYTRLMKYLGVQSVGIWNDDICKSKEQAIAAMIGAASEVS